MHGIQNTRLFRKSCYINGKWIQAISGKIHPVTNPVDGSTLGHTPDCDQTDTHAAIEAAHAAWLHWKDLAAIERCKLLMAWTNLINKNKEDL
ncbi:MAG: aldehyde dehydrogenase family protein, partial [Gammaproteobacteria bacterium]|nr:aldehyde dehydrogenase family protein [Gammaproteobacteria bacterium]